MGADEDERLQAEVELLEAMYPEQISYNAKSRELKYTSDEAAFVVRLPSGYLTDELPEAFSASIGKKDARAELKQQIQSLSAGEEVLDSLIAAFSELAASRLSEGNAKREDADGHQAVAATNSFRKATIIVWLHHLLNTNKRKLALSPPSGVSGITKPGYPGVLIYSGPESAVQEQITELKQQNWQAFQVRLESDEEWTFSHGQGVKEVEAMKDIVAGIGEARKEVFMEAMRMK